MIGISNIYCGSVESSDALRYDRKSSMLPSHLLQFSKDKKPVVVWNTTRRCNLNCVHCYSHSSDKMYSGEMNTDEGIQLIDQLAEFKCPVILFSGGEPLLRKDLPQLAQYAIKSGLRAVISTNGTLITDSLAGKLKDVGLSYVGVSLDGIRSTNDRFRGVSGAFDKALEGIRNCMKAGIKVGLRFTINKRNFLEIPQIFDLLEQENIPRICLYHLVYAGRGNNLRADELTSEEVRNTIDLIINRTANLHSRGKQVEVLTVDNHADAVYLYLRMLREKSPRASDVLKLLKMNGGNSSGAGIGCVSWDGSVHADQFWRHYSFGNVRNRSFGDIWRDLSDPVMAGLKNRKGLLGGKCKRCVWKDICNGNLRVRAEAVYNDIWAEDPACYLSEEEISVRV